VLRTVNDQPTLWDAILPPELLVLPAELVGWMHSWMIRCSSRLSMPGSVSVTFARPSIPMETYLRLMFLKFRYPAGL
jgi:IS5 family transposase